MIYFSDNTIKARLLLPLSLLLISFLLIFIYIFSNEEQSHINEDFMHSVKAAQLNYNSALIADTHKLSAAMEYLQNDEKLRNGLITGNREDTLQYAAPIFENLRAKFLITHFYLLTPERKVLLRVHEPDRHSDIINRYTAIQAEQTGLAASGIELGTLGTFTLRVVYPIYASSKLIGYLELGEEIEHIISNLTRSMGIELAIAINKQLLSRRDWEQGIKMLGKQTDWDHLSSFVETYSSINVPLKTLTDILHDPSSQHDGTMHDFDNKHYFAISQPLIDIRQHEVGRLLILRNMTERIAGNQQAILNISLLAFTLGFFVLIFFYFLADRIEHRLESSRKKLIDEAETRERLQQAHIIELETSQTQLLEAQNQIIQARDIAESANRAKSEFLSGMSHELRTPLNIILGYAQILEIQADQKTASQDETAKHILTAGYQMLDMVNELLDLASTDLSQLQLNIQPCSITDLITSCVDQITTSMAQQKNIFIENKITDNNFLVLADQQRLRQTLINLLNNAVKYNKENGRVTINSIIENEGKLKVTVIDTGCGIAEDKLSLLFTPFERIDQKHGSISGIGLGLYIAKQLVEAMDGSIGVNAKGEEGCTFWIEIPMAEVTQLENQLPNIKYLMQ